MSKKIVKRNVMVILLLVVGFSAYSMLANAGSLEPTASPGPTMKTLDEVEPRIPIPGSSSPVGPFNITESGSYYLTGDRIASAGGIIVLDHNVTIDLQGYTLIGSNSGSYSGISLGIAGGANVEIRNGTIRNFAGSGIYEFHISGENHRVIDVRVTGNGSSGIYLNGYGHLVQDCTVSYNGDSSSSMVYGIYGGYGSIVIGNTVYGNGKSASGDVESIYVSPGCTVKNNTIYDNGNSAKGSYVDGIFTGVGSTITGNTVFRNGIKADGSVYGIYVVSDCLVSQNTAFNNGVGAGFATNMNLGVLGSVYGINVAP